MGKEVKFRLLTTPFIAFEGNAAVKQANGPRQGAECRSNVHSSNKDKQTSFSETLQNASQTNNENIENQETAKAATNHSVSKLPEEARFEKSALKETQSPETGADEMIMQLLELIQEVNQAVNQGVNLNSTETGSDNQTGILGGGFFGSETYSLISLLENLTGTKIPDSEQFMKALGSFLKTLEALGTVSPELNELKLLIQNQLSFEETLPQRAFLDQLAAKLSRLAAIKGDGSIENQDHSTGSPKIQPGGGQVTTDTMAAVQAKKIGSTSANAVRPGKATGASEINTGMMVKGNTGAVANGNTDSVISTRENGSPGTTDSGSGPESGKLLFGTTPETGSVLRTVSQNQNTAPENAKQTYNSDTAAEGLRIEQQLHTQVGTQQQFMGNGSADGGSMPGQVSQATQSYQTDTAVFNQIIQKVQLAASPEKSEMQIELKPEFLGKLKLTVSTENGLVTARFDTPSSQVKAVIEANLPALKDTLADQGIKVDQLSVTVTPEKNYSGQGEREGMFKKRTQTRGNRLPLNEGQLETVFLSTADRLGVAGYYGNTVDFTA
ncbi:flagellar hook-length control protein FliK [Phosphitispora sp. TUW77]|uniref:flagellar hook-length control protein FliK n=1 Tax=Phosphitispora sp. TUW77 TaxID=3152361 RepID=UPI003AB61213